MAKRKVVSEYELNQQMEELAAQREECIKQDNQEIADFLRKVFKKEFPLEKKARKDFIKHLKELYDAEQMAMKQSTVPPAFEEIDASMAAETVTKQEVPTVATEVE